MAHYWLTPPSRVIFFLSVLLAVLALLVRYAHVAIPIVSHYTFETLLLAFVLLLAGNMFRGL
jgi:predicted tellurium resistance membrane protein TerC